MENELAERGKMEAGTLGVIGASGFIGGAVVDAATSKGWEVVGFSRKERSPAGAVKSWRKWSDSPDLNGLDAVINLSGAPIDQRWTEENKRKFRESRVGVTETLVRAIGEASGGPRVLINGSAVGIYGDRGEERLVESASPGDGYLADLCQDWEASAERAESCRVILWRTGVVLGAGGAAWKKMKMAFSLGLGGRFGGGEQWMPWVHVDDLAGAMIFALENGLAGPVNGTAPAPVRNSEFTTKLAKALHRPAFLHAPAWALRVGLGEFSSALLASQRAVPEVLEQAGYHFKFGRLEDALADLTGKAKGGASS